MKEDIIVPKVTEHPNIKQISIFYRKRYNRVNKYYEGRE
ncbi:hypothetical protein CHCC20335_2788 [Bacillus paralicheniformis]|nr:hypothetical protein CHCC20335_2788 [Bacillus paralicheniformis]